MTEQISGGHFLLSRKIFKSAIWGKHPQYTRLLIWFIGKAVFQDGHTFKGHVLKRGDLITTHGEIADALSYRFNRAIIMPSVKEIRIMLSWMQSNGMILMKPLIDGTLVNKGRPTDLTRAYVGLLISIVNYDTYQCAESYKGRDKGRPSVEQGQLRVIRRERNNNTLSESDLSDFEKFYSAYPKHESKKKAMDTWVKLHPDNDLQQNILDAIEKQKIHKDGLTSRNEFCPEWPMPATWLNQRRWEDEISSEVKKSSW